MHGLAELAGDGRDFEADETGADHDDGLRRVDPRADRIRFRLRTQIKDTVEFGAFDRKQPVSDAFILLKKC